MKKEIGFVPTACNALFPPLSLIRGEATFPFLRETTQRGK
jgi:hypothetical protein